jgi:hypothetical protein
MVLVPVGLKSIGSDTGEIGSLLSSRTARSKRAAASVELVASQAIGLLETGLSSFQLREVGDAQVGVASSTAGKQILFGEHRFRPMRDRAVRVRSLGRSPLPAVTNRATVRGGIVDDVGVAPENPVPFDATLTRRHSHMATDTSIRRADFAADNLSQLNRKRIGLGRGQPRLNPHLNHAPVA